VLVNPQNLKASARSRGAAPSTLDRLRAAANEAGRISVIVGLRVPFAAEGLLDPGEMAQQRAEIEATAGAVRARFAPAASRSPHAFQGFESIPFVGLEVTPAELERLAADPDVISLSENRRNKPMLAGSVPMIQGDQAHTAGFTGAGTAVAILDTGVEKSHSFFGGRVIAEACFSTSWSSNRGSFVARSLCPNGAASSTAPGSAAPCNIDGCSHGTHVAGIAAGSNTSVSGMAPRASIIAVQVFSNVVDGNGSSAEAFDSDIIAGLEHIYDKRKDYSIAAVNLSLGKESFAAFCDTENSAMKSAIDNLRAAGIATIAASGNDGFTGALASPACISSVISVGAVAVANTRMCGDESVPLARDKVACYSNSASFLSLLAPGHVISSSVPGNRFGTKYGTSMAAPHVAGAWALMKQRVPTTGVSQVLEAFKSTGTQVTDYRVGITKPRINVKAALDLLASSVRDLAFTKTGTGQGTVTFSPAASQRSCSSNCVNSYLKDTEVTLTAEAANGSVFNGWEGHCSGTLSCTLTMNEARQVTAIFASTTGGTRTLSYSKEGAGQGTVTFSPAGSTASCADSCTTDFAYDTLVTVQPGPLLGSAFMNWKGACRGKRSCKIRMSTARFVTAVFEPVPIHTLSYRAEGSGSGRISFTRPSTMVGCAANCTRDFSHGNRVILTAQPDLGSRFAGWGGRCRGRRSCTVDMTVAHTVTAKFETVPVNALTLTMQGQGKVSFFRPTNQAACTESCTRNFIVGTRVKLLADPAPGYRFAGWQGNCGGRRSCTVVLKSPKSVTAVFSPISSANGPQMTSAE
jgi:subtilisin family serine protease